MSEKDEKDGHESVHSSVSASESGTFLGIESFRNVFWQEFVVFDVKIVLSKF